jgi:SAM-dependent methyltransferase
VVVEGIFRQVNVSRMRMLHFAPGAFFEKIFARRFSRYETADLDMERVDHRVDLQALPFGDGSYDFIFASHVLEHVPDDTKALKEIRRVLRPGGGGHPPRTGGM